MTLKQLAIFVIACLSTQQAFSEECRELSEEKLASAGVFQNATYQRGSLRRESKEMLDKAIKMLPKTKSCENSNCSTKPPKIEFSSVPNKFLNNYSESEKCKAMHEKTSKTPLSYKTQAFTEFESLSKWIGEFSRGRGELGELLYEQCSGSCSPQFNYEIEVKNEQLEVRPVVVCGPARDKSDNTYKLSYEISCPKVENSEN